MITIEKIISQLGSRDYEVERGYKYSDNKASWTTKITYRKKFELCSVNSTRNQDEADIYAISMLMRYVADSKSEETYMMIKESLVLEYGKEPWLSSAGIGYFGPQITVVKDLVPTDVMKELKVRESNGEFYLRIVEQHESYTNTGGDE